MKTDKQMAAAAADFAQRWEGKGYERGQSQLFWADLLTNVFGVENLPDFVRYEEQVASMVDSTNFIDVHIPSTKVLIEQKSINIDLRKPVKRGDAYITPFLQAKQYIVNMRQSEHPRWVVTCNFRSFLVYDMDQPNSQPEEILLKDLATEYYRLKILVDVKSEHISKEEQVSKDAGAIVGKIYDALLTQYDDSSPEALRWLNILCVRLVFCLYAEDAGVFTRDQFHNFLVIYEAKDLRRALRDLFEVLKTPTEKRSKYLQPELAAFPYTNGGLFEEEIEIPQFTEELKQTLLQHASLDFDWSKISPTIFGALFESTLNPETRRSGGMHYTSIENIHKVIDPLFLDDLRQEFDTILEEKVEKQRVRRLDAFQDKLASLTFLDPACGSGNFLTETYLSLRRLENDVIRARHHDQTFLGFEEVNPIKVSIQQFYGIEINDFAVTVATTALWISEAQMLAETEKIISRDIQFLPLKPYHNIREGNALRMEWDVIEVPSNIPTIHAKNVHLIYEDEAKWMAGESVIELDDVNMVVGDYQRGFKSNAKRYEVYYDYIIGNPPFCGRRYRTPEQIEDVARYYDYKDIDYVACWYKKAANLIKGKDTRCAFVSTNSITQGEQVPALWNDLGVHIDFARRTFRWDSEASLKAHVHCVIIGFSSKGIRNPIIYDGERTIQANNINGYLLDAPDSYITLRSKPICDVPLMRNGNVPLDGDALKVEAEDFNLFSACSHLLKRLIGGRELLHNEPRYVLWLVGVSPAEIKKYPQVYKRVELCRNNRLAMKDKGTQKLADSPTTFRDTLNPDNYIALPMVSSERRRYIPMSYFHEDTIPTNQVQIIPNATLYHFGILESNVHMAWMRAVCGRLKSDYRYSKDVVYNNFPWPTPTGEQKAKIEQTAQAILDARALYPDSSLADLYDEVAMPIELRKAHQNNDRAVMAAYGFPVKSTFTESQCVAELFKMYQELTK